MEAQQGETARHKISARSQNFDESIAVARKITRRGLLELRNLLAERTEKLESAKPGKLQTTGASGEEIRRNISDAPRQESW